MYRLPPPSPAALAAYQQGPKYLDMRRVLGVRPPGLCSSMWKGHRCALPRGHAVNQSPGDSHHDGRTAYWTDEPEWMRRWERRSTSDIEQAAADAEVEPDEQPAERVELTGVAACSAIEQAFARLLKERGL